MNKNERFNMYGVQFGYKEIMDAAFTEAKASLKNAAYYRMDGIDFLSKEYYDSYVANIKIVLALNEKLKALNK